MPRLISIVDLVSGIVEDISSETATLDLPKDIDGLAREVSLDGLGTVHYDASSGLRRTADARVVPLSDRRSGETCLVCGQMDDTDAAGLRRFHLSLLDD